MCQNGTHRSDLCVGSSYCGKSLHSFGSLFLSLKIHTRVYTEEYSGRTGQRCSSWVRCVRHHIPKVLNFYKFHCSVPFRTGAAFSPGLQIRITAASWIWACLRPIPCIMLPAQQYCTVKWNILPCAMKRYRSACCWGASFQRVRQSELADVI